MKTVELRPLRQQIDFSHKESAMLKERIHHWARKIAPQQVQQPITWLLLVVGIIALLLAFIGLGIFLYQQHNWLIFGVFIAACLGVGGLAAYLYGELGYHRRQHYRLTELNHLSRSLLGEAAANIVWADLLTTHMADIFPDCWVDIRLPLTQSIYRQGVDWPPLADVWASLPDDHQPYQLIRAAARHPHKPATLDALVIPIITLDDNRRIGGILILSNRQIADVTEWLPILRSLAAQLAAMQHRLESYKQAIEYQAQIYEKELYEQAYRSEVYAQMLAYERMTQELTLAGHIQASFLPQSVPELAGWQISVSLEPARETSGDFYDLIPLPDNRLGILMADVADKGIGAALFMAMSRTLIRTYALQYPEEPEKVLAVTNSRILADTHSDMFVTVFYGILDLGSGELIYCNAGHNPPYLWTNRMSTEDSRPIPLTRTALPVGLFDEFAWKQGAIQLEPGAVLILYTDGITEAQDEAEEFYGEDRLQGVVSCNLDRSADIIEDKITTSINQFVGEASQADDITLMVVVREPIPLAASTQLLS